MAEATARRVHLCIDAALTLFHSRFGQQLATCSTSELLDNWTEFS